MNRRLAMLAGTAAAAGAAGAAVAWWRRDSPGREAGAEIWSLQFDRPDGTRLVLADFRGKPLLVNFWATWCPPCVRELPLIDRFQNDQRARGWQVVGIAVDNLQPVREFLQKRPVGFGVGLAGIEGVDLSRRLGNSGGALPFSVVFDRRGDVVQRKLGVIQPEDLAQWVTTVG
jgi:thiol-disulfide isomerase/thioredoxin